MAVQAQYPTNVLLPDLRNRTRQSLAGENRNFISAPGYGLVTLEDYQQLQSATVAGGAIQLRLFGSIAGTNPAQQALDGVVSDNENELGCDLIPSRKRLREVDDLLAAQRCQLPNAVEFHQNHGAASVIIPQSAGVSTGLKLAFEDEKLNPASSSTSGRAEGSSFPVLSFLSDEVSTHLQQQRAEIDQYLKAQGAQVRQNLEERRQRHSKCLLSVIEEGIVKRLRDKEIEVQNVNRRHKELEERVKLLTVEAHLWQKLAKNNEAMVTALRNNLQQAVVLSREQSREGCGDSEADDAASSHHDDLADAHARAFKENKELKEQRICRVCQCNDVSILLLPCRHLCLCKDCDSRLDACPICRSMKNASVQVYML